MHQAPRGFILAPSQARCRRVACVARVADLAIPVRWDETRSSSIETPQAIPFAIDLKLSERVQSRSSGPRMPRSPWREILTSHFHFPLEKEQRRTVRASSMEFIGESFRCGSKVKTHFHVVGASRERTLQAHVSVSGKSYNEARITGALSCTALVGCVTNVYAYAYVTCARMCVRVRVRARG